VTSRAAFDGATRRRILANAANWDARTPVHERSAFYGLDGTRDAGYWFADFEWEDLGRLSGRDVLHAQCHLGTETIAFAREGARTVGLDISSRSIRAARRIAADAGARIEYVCADVYDALEVLGSERFDVIYTGKGALCYLPDLERWAAILHDLLKPDGRVYVVEFHPLLNALGPAPQPDASEELLLLHDYLAGRGPLERDSTYTYTDGPAVQGATVSYEWAHGLGEVVNTFIGAGLRIDRLRESEPIPWPRWPHMERTERGWWRLPDAAPRIPLLYALLATKSRSRRT
jgi:SAM-dependent methyltransferase